MKYKLLSVLLLLTAMIPGPTIHRQVDHRSPAQENLGMVSVAAPIISDHEIVHSSRSARRVSLHTHQQRREAAQRRRREAAQRRRREAAQRRRREAAQRRRLLALRKKQKAQKNVSRQNVRKHNSNSSAEAWAHRPFVIRMANCESGAGPNDHSVTYDGNPHLNDPNGHYGKYQFDFATWASVGGSGNPANASVAEQDYRAWLLWKSRGFEPWECAGMVD